MHLLGIRLTTLFAAGGFFALGAGFAVRHIVENLVSGAVLRLEKTIRPGDLVVVRDKWVVIQHIGLRATMAKTADGEDILLPNVLVAQSIVENLTRSDRLYRLRVDVGVPHESELALVRETLEQTVRDLDWPSTAEQPVVHLDSFGGASVNYSVVVWISDIDDAARRKSDLHEAIWKGLRDKGITIAHV